MDKKIKDQLKKKREELLEIRDLRSEIKVVIGYLFTTFENTRIRLEEVRGKSKDREEFLIELVTDILPLITDYISKTKLLNDKMFKFLKNRLYENEEGLLD